jgi:hypothetical protein
MGKTPKKPVFSQPRCDKHSFDFVEPVCAKNDDQFRQDRRWTNTGKVERRETVFRRTLRSTRRAGWSLFLRPIAAVTQSAPRRPRTTAPRYWWERRLFGAILKTMYNEMIMLPRQARDKDRESTQKTMRRSVSICLKPTPSSSGDTTQVRKHQTQNLSHMHLISIDVNKTDSRLQFECSIDSGN